MDSKPVYLWNCDYLAGHTANVVLLGVLFAVWQLTQHVLLEVCGRV